MTKEALKLALEALEIEEAQTHYPSQWLLKAITTIKQSLANDALEKKAENAKELGLDYEPEPVAWRTKVDHIMFTSKRKDVLPLGGDLEPLYTTPPQRKPLTDEEIRKANHHMVEGAYDYSFKQGVKWAEYKHGIKGEA